MIISSLKMIGNAYNNVVNLGLFVVTWIILDLLNLGYVIQLVVQVDITIILMEMKVHNMIIPILINVLIVVAQAIINLSLLLFV